MKLAVGTDEAALGWSSEPKPAPINKARDAAIAIG